VIQWQLKLFNDLTAAELYTILRARSEVFVLEQSCPYVDPDGKDLHSYHLTGYVGEDMAAYSRIVFPGISYDEVSIGRVITTNNFRGKEYGKLLMQKSIEEIERLYGKVPIRIGAQAYLKKFYEGFGFVDLNEPYLEDGIPHMIMLRFAV
jgi:ElaA protein